MTHEHFDSQLLSPTSNLDCVLDGLAERINTLNDASLSAIRSSFEHAAECGKLLIEAKELVGHGGWSGWLAANTRISDRTARRWMRFARHGREVADKTAIVADLTFAEMEAALFLKDKKVIGLRQGTERYTEEQIKIDEIERLAARRNELRKRREAWLALYPSESEYTADGMEEAIAIIIENARIETEWFGHYPGAVNEAWPVAYRRRLAEIAKAGDPRSVVIDQLRCGEYPHLTDEDVSAIKAQLPNMLRGILLADRVRDFHDLDGMPKARDAAIKKIFG